MDRFYIHDMGKNNSSLSYKYIMHRRIVVAIVVKLTKDPEMPRQPDPQIPHCNSHSEFPMPPDPSSHTILFPPPITM
jgi:hypothetical protein